MKIRIQSLLCLVLVFLTVSCFQESKDLKAANEFLQTKNYAEAIALLDKYSSNKAQELNSKAHLDYAVSILANIDEKKQLRYLNAKQNLRKSLDLNPENREAKVFYKMLSKTIEREFPSGL